MNIVGIILLALLTITSLQCAPQNGNFNDLIKMVFGNQTGATTPPPTTSDPPTGVPVTTGCSDGFECVPHYLCSDSDIIKDGRSLIEIKFDGPPKECTYLEQCCKFESKITEPLVLPPPTSEGCGFRNVDGVGFKITGEEDNETEYGEFPWMVAVLKVEKAENGTSNIYKCGGSLIHPGVVLTGAHCVSGKSADTLRIRAGEWDTQTNNELLPHQDREVDEVVVHEHYNKGSLHNDIALLFLSSPVELAENVKTVCLPPPKTIFDYTRCIATGWGKSVFGLAGKYQVIMKKVELPIVPNDACQASLRTTHLGKYFELDQSFICAGGETGKDTCKGDGGSPLVCPIAGKNEQYYQAGIVAWGIGCGEGNPGAYASVSALRDWLDEQLAYKKIDSKFYTP